MQFIPSDSIVAQYIKTDLTRREFLKKTLALSAGFALSPLLQVNELFAADVFKRRGYVGQIKHSKSVERFRDNKAVVREMIEEGMMRLTGKTNSSDAWKMFFNSQDIVAIKINPIDWMKRNVTHRSMVDAVTDKLQQIGVAPHNIIVWDRYEPHVKDAGYTINHAKNGIRYMGTEFRTTGKQFILDYGRPYIAEPASRELGNKSFVTSILTKMATKCINMPLLKDHADAGITFCLKNLAFGAVNNTRRFHASSCNPMIAEVCSLPEIKNKTVLNIGDGLNAIFEGGPFLKSPRNRWMEKSIFFGTDMVAMDAVGLDIIEKKRKEKNLPSLWIKHYKPYHIKTAGLKGLGEHELSKIKHEFINLG